MKKMKTTLATALLALVAVCGSASITAAQDKTVMVGGQAMYSNKDIIDNAVNSADHTTLVAAVKAAGLVDTLKGPGPFTVFAPTNEAFAKLPAGTVDTLLKPENHDMLVKILTYHVVAGRYSTAMLKKEIRAAHGQATLKTVSGGTLTFMMNGDDNIIIKGRERRLGQSDDREREPVERRYSSDRHRATPELTHSSSSTKMEARFTPEAGLRRFLPRGSPRNPSFAPCIRSLKGQYDD